MNAFVKAVEQVPDAFTENGAPTFSSSLNCCVDFFSKAGSMRSNPEGLLDLFKKAWHEDHATASRIVLWLRDVREGSGERQSFRNIVRYMINSPSDRGHFDTVLEQVLTKVPELGRWDDLVDVIENFTGSSNEPHKVTDKEASDYALGIKSKDSVEAVRVNTVALNWAARAASLIKTALDEGNGLCAKWMPRKGIGAHFLRTSFDWTPKYYRKRLVELSNTVEQMMCANQWDKIEFSKLPSVAQFRYQGAFERHTPDAYKAFTAKAASGEVKVNAGAIFPHTIVKQVLVGGTYNNDLVNAQWDALPNYIGDSSVIPVIDVSGSMGCEISPGTQALHVSIGLGIYCASKNRGVFKDVFIEFSSKSRILKLTAGRLVDKVRALQAAHWEMTTNLQAAFDEILRVATKSNAPQSDLPQTLLILSDMEFDAATGRSGTNFQVAQDKFKAAGYEMPKVVFWNLNARNVGNSPVRFDQNGAALVSGFSPAILKAVLEGGLLNFTPQAVMLKTLSNPRYEVVI